MAGSKNIFKVKAYIKAKSEDELIQAQLRNNVLNDRMYDYKVIWNGKEYVAWFWADISIWKKERGK